MDISGPFHIDFYLEWAPFICPFIQIYPGFQG